MIVINHNDYSNNFIYNYIPKVIETILLEKISTYRNNKLINYIENTFKINIYSFIKFICSSIKITFNGNRIIINFDKNILIEDTSISYIINLLDCGALDMKGLHLIDNTEKYIQSNIDYLYSEYLLFYGG